MQLPAAKLVPKQAHCTCCAILSALILLGACGLNDDPPPNPKTKQDGGITIEDGGQMPAPTVDPVPATACTDTVPIHGSTLPGASVFVQGGASSAGVSTDANPVTGQFCLDVPLQPERENVLEVRAFSGDLGSSEAVEISVTHVSCEDTDPQDPADDEPVNVAAGVLAKASLEPLDSEMSALTDGDLQTVTVFQDDWGSAVGDADEWVMLSFDELVAPESVVVHWRDNQLTGDAYAESYKLLISDIAEPGDPSLENEAWHEIGDVTAGDGGEDVFTLPTPNPLVRHLALWLIEDHGSGRDTFAISELEVMVPAKSSGPNPDENTCASLGL